MKAAKPSKYRFIQGKIQNNKDVWYLDVKQNNNSGDYTTIRASSAYIGVNWESGSAIIGVIPLTFLGKRDKPIPLLPAHGGKLTDFAFSPFDPTILCSASDDATVKLWSLPSDISSLGEFPSSPLLGLVGHKKNVETLAFHPSASNVLATGSMDSTVRVWDLNVGEEKGAIPLSDNGMPSISWSYDGSILAAISRDKKIRTLDLRGKAVYSEGNAHDGTKPPRVLCLGLTNKIFSTGSSQKTRQREYAIWDIRDLSKPIKLTSLDSNTGVLTPVFDVDTNLLYLGGQGDSLIRVLEINETGAVQEYPDFSSGGNPQRGLCAIPKQSCTILECEISRLLRLTKDAIIPVSFTVARKSKSNFSDVEELYPPTLSFEPAITAEDYFSGKDSAPKLMSLAPYAKSPYAYLENLSIRDSSSSSSSTTKSGPSTTPISLNPPASSSSSSISSIPSSKNSISTPTSPSINSPTLTAVQSSSVTSSPITRSGVVPKVVRSSKFRHIVAKPISRPRVFENLKVNGSIDNAIAGNSAFFATPWIGTGGLLAVIPLSATGRLPNTVPCLEVGSQITDFSLSPFHNEVIATGAEDAHVKIWNVTADTILSEKKNLTEPQLDLTGHTRKLNTVNFHPSVDHLLVTSGSDQTVRFWDLLTGSEQLALRDLHKDIIMSISWNYEGSIMSTTSKDKYLRLFDPRASSQLITEVVSHLGAKGGKAVWLTPTEKILSVGFGKSSEREIVLWDTRNLGKGALVTHSIDHLSGLITPYYDEDIGVVYLAGKGDGNIKSFEIENDDVHYLTEYSSISPQIGVFPLPKSTLDVRACEIARFLKVTNNTCEFIQMTVPRTRIEYFQDDLYPPTRDFSQPSNLSSNWLSGENNAPKVYSLHPTDMKLLSTAPALPKAAPSALQVELNDPTPSKEKVLTSFHQTIIDRFKEGDAVASQPVIDGAEEEDDEWK